MRNCLLIIITLILSINLSAQTSKRVIKLSGTIAEKYPILMTLTFQDTVILGFYHYEKYQSKILLEGQISGNRMVLKESSDYESEFKMGFIGDLTKSSFTGVWIDKINNKSLPFATSTQSDQKINLSNQVVSLAGTYESIYNSDTYFASVEFQHIVEEFFCFEISNGTESGCTGYIKGLVKLTDLREGIYSRDACEELTFVLSSKELSLTEENCDYHGMQCPFEGKYVKLE